MRNDKLSIPHDLKRRHGRIKVDIKFCQAHTDGFDCCVIKDEVYQIVRQGF